MSVRVRIAPSPTGPMHVGTARTALFNWLFAKKNNGVFILRIEDTDKERSKKEYEENIIKGLEWLGLDYAEGPVRQSERTKIYNIYIKKLLASGNAFYCRHTPGELEKEKEGQMANKEAPRHVCNQKSAPTSPPPSGPPLLTKERGCGGEVGGVIRFSNPGGRIKFIDLIRGAIEFNVDLLGDFSIAKDENTPLYNLAAAIDDYEMKISHVIRGEDHISNTPKQLLIYKALVLEPPQYAHLPMILGTDKSKLSKRHGATSLLEYRDQGYLPDAMFNFLALLGWNPGGSKEIMSRDDIVQKFSLAAVQKSGAVFNVEKLDWMNGEYIRNVPLQELVKLCEPYLPQDSDLDLTKIVSLEQPRLKRIAEIGESTGFFFEDKLEYEKELLRWKNMTDDETQKKLEGLEKLLSDIPGEDYTRENLEKVIMPKAEEWGRADGKVDRGRTLWPLRVALTGRKASPGPFEVAEILGKKKCLARVREARNIF